MLVLWSLQKSGLSLILMILISIPVFGFFLYSNSEKYRISTTSISVNITADRQTKSIHSYGTKQNLKGNATLKTVTTVSHKLNNTLKTAVSNEITTTSSSIAANNSSVSLTTVGDYYEGGFLTNLNICPEFGKEVKLLIFVTSAPNHSDARLSIRETWGSFTKMKNVDLAFLLGTSVNETLNNIIQEEQELYGDILIGNFMDSYDNLTLKTMAMHDWIISYCSEAKFVLKTDDDMFIHVSRLLNFINKIKPEKETLYGRVVKKWKPVRTKASKYYLSEEQYKEKIFPDFTTGPAYLFPTQLSEKLFSAALNRTYIKLEDVFFNGVLASDLRILRKHNNQFMNRWVKSTPCNIQRVISVHHVSSSQQYTFWKLAHDNCSSLKSPKKGK